MNPPPKHVMQAYMKRKRIHTTWKFGICYRKMMNISNEDQVLRTGAAPCALHEDVEQRDLLTIAK